MALGNLALLALLAPLLQHLLQGVGFLRLQPASLVRPIGHQRHTANASTMAGRASSRNSQRRRSAQAAHVTWPLGSAAGTPARVQAAEPQTTPAVAEAPEKAAEKAPEPDIRNFIGAWAITDNLNNLFNVRLYSGGKAVSTVGTTGVASAGATRISARELRELGR